MISYTSFVRIEERRILHQIVEKVRACNACLTELLDFALSHLDKDLSAVIEKMSIAYKVSVKCSLID